MTSSCDHPTEVTVQLPHDASAPGTARDATRVALRRWRLPTMLDAVVLSVSELVTNGFAHGRPTLSLRLRREPSAVSVHVHDGTPATAMTGSTTDDAESGRGLQIVRAVSDSLTVEDLDGDGKVVHAVFDVPQEAPVP